MLFQGFFKWLFHALLLLKNELFCFWHVIFVFFIVCFFLKKKNMYFFKKKNMFWRFF